MMIFTLHRVTLRLMYFHERRKAANITEHVDNFEGNKLVVGCQQRSGSNRFMTSLTMAPNRMFLAIDD
jgi:hypothetical protein